MSPASHMIGRLRKLYGIVWSRTHFLNERLTHPPVGRQGIASQCMVEPLEPRVLLSGSTTQLDGKLPFTYVIYDPSTRAPYVRPAASGVSPTDSLPFLSSSSPVGLIPSQIRAAYGINSILMGSIVGDGTGQTIAVIDAYDDPAFVNSTDPNFVNSDLHKFDLQFGLPDPPSFQKFDQNGDTSYPPNDTEGWATEEALDIEWAHAIAPNANIVAIEANSGEFSSQSFTDEGKAVDTARHLPGVSVISMSYGWSESFINTTVGAGAEVAQNPLYTTPAGHVGVTFLASTGDSGSPGGYPAYSPNVVAVGGTTLTLSGGSYGSEVGWSGSGGGQSALRERAELSERCAKLRLAPDSGRSL